MAERIAASDMGAATAELPPAVALPNLNNLVTLATRAGRLPGLLNAGYSGHDSTSFFFITEEAMIAASNSLAA